MAVVFGTSGAQQDIGVGAAMGGPLALATVAYGVTGWMMLARRLRGLPQPGAGLTPEWTIPGRGLLGRPGRHDSPPLAVT